MNGQTEYGDVGIDGIVSLPHCTGTKQSARKFVFDFFHESTAADSDQTPVFNAMGAGAELLREQLTQSLSHWNACGGTPVQSTVSHSMAGKEGVPCWVVWMSPIEAGWKVGLSMPRVPTNPSSWSFWTTASSSPGCTPQIIGPIWRKLGSERVTALFPLSYKVVGRRYPPMSFKFAHLARDSFTMPLSIASIREKSLTVQGNSVPSA